MIFGSSSSPFFFSLCRHLLARQGSKEEKTRMGQSSGRTKSVIIQWGEASTNVELKETSPMWVDVQCYIQKWGRITYGPGFAVCSHLRPIFLTYCTWRDIWMFGTKHTFELQKIWGCFLSCFVWTAVHLQTLEQKSCTRKMWLMMRQWEAHGWFSWCLSCLKTKSTGLHFWFKWVICIEKFISTGHKDMVIKEGNKNFNYDRILKVAVNWRQAAKWPLQSVFLGWDW